MSIKQFANKEYKRFCKAQGSQHIVSEFALFNILKLIKKYEPVNILEVGVGIGTIAGSILKFAREEELLLSVSGTESNDFCRSQIPENLGTEFNKLKLFKNVTNLPADDKYDFIIIDGAEENLSLIKNKINAEGIVVVEGDRTDQVTIVKKIFPKAKLVQIISLNRNGEYSVKNTDDYQGGLKLIFTTPTFHQILHWLLLKIQTKIKFKQRKYSG